MIKHLPENHSNNFIKLRNSLISATGKAIGDYNMIVEGDTVLVCMSGGKDSHAMLMILLALQERAPINFQNNRHEFRPKTTWLPCRYFACLF